MPTRKLAETDVSNPGASALHPRPMCAITSSIDTIPPEMILQEMREGWLRELRQAVGALVLVVERLTDGPTAAAQP
jgi:aspartate carbamoyltransferase catalytic subunit